MKKFSSFIATVLITMAFLSSCDDESAVYDTINGKLVAGVDVTDNDLQGVTVYLGKFHDSIDFDNISMRTTAIDSVTTVVTNSNGEFEFTGLPSGNYGIALGPGYIFSIDTVLAVELDGSDHVDIQNTVDRISEENWFKGCVYYLVADEDAEFYLSNSLNQECNKLYQIDIYKKDGDHVASYSNINRYYSYINGGYSNPLLYGDTYYNKFTFIQCNNDTIVSSEIYLEKGNFDNDSYTVGDITITFFEESGWLWWRKPNRFELTD